MSINAWTAGDPITAARLQEIADAINKTVYDEGFLPFAYPVGYEPPDASANSTALAAVSSGKAGINISPFYLPAPMRIQSVTIRNNDTASARSCEFGLYRDVGTATLQRVTGTDGTLSFTPGGAASDRTGNVSTPGTLLLPGTYWLAIRNTSGSQVFTMRRGTSAPEASGNLCYTDNTPNATSLGTTLDTSALTWTGSTAQAVARLNGRVWGGSAAF